MLTDKLVSTNTQENGKLEEEIKEIRKILALQSDEIKLIKNTHEIKLHKRDSVINKLKTRINVLENDVSIGKIKMEHSNFHMMAEVTSRNEQVLNYARDQIQSEGSMANKFIKFVYADTNSSLMAFTYTGRFQKFNLEVELNDIALHVDNTSRSSEGIYDMIGKQFESLHPGE